MKTCKQCGNEFQPTDGRQAKCFACRSGTVRYVKTFVGKMCECGQPATRLRCQTEPECERCHRLELLAAEGWRRERAEQGRGDGAVAWPSVGAVMAV